MPRERDLSTRDDVPADVVPELKRVPAPGRSAQSLLVEHRLKNRVDRARLQESDADRARVRGVEGVHDLPVRPGLHGVHVLSPLAGDALVGHARAIADCYRLDRSRSGRVSKLNRPPWASQGG